MQISSYKKTSQRVNKGRYRSVLAVRYGIRCEQCLSAGMKWRARRFLSYVKRFTAMTEHFECVIQV